MSETTQETDSSDEQVRRETLRVYAVGHYSQLAAFWAILAFFIYIGVMNELHPAPLLEACPVTHSTKVTP